MNTIHHANRFTRRRWTGWLGSGSLLCLHLVSLASAAGGSAAPEKIVFVSKRGSGAGLFIMDGDGSNQARITTPSGRDEHVPTWSPDGCLIAFRRDVDIYVMSPDGTNTRRIRTTLGVDPEFDLRLHFTPDGRFVNFVDGFASVDGSQPPSLVVGVAWSPDGSKLVYASKQGLSLLEVNGSMADPELARQIEQDAGRTILGAHVLQIHESDQRVVWSPDATRIALAGAQEGSLPQLVVIDVATATVTRLTDGPDIAQRPVWSPDGSKLAFESIAESSGGVVARLEVANSDGTGRTVLDDRLVADLFETRTNRISWSVDGKRLVFARESGAPGAKEQTVDVYTVNVDGAGLRRLTDDGVSWSPASSPQEACPTAAGSLFTSAPLTGDPGRRERAAERRTRVFKPGQAVYVVAMTTDGFFDLTTESEAKKAFTKQRAFRIAERLEEADFAFLLLAEYGASPGLPGESEGDWPIVIEEEETDDSRSRRVKIGGGSSNPPPPIVNAVIAAALLPEDLRAYGRDVHAVREVALWTEMVSHGKWISTSNGRSTVPKKAVNKFHEAVLDAK